MKSGCHQIQEQQELRNRRFARRRLLQGSLETTQLMPRTITQTVALKSTPMVTGPEPEPVNERILAHVVNFEEDGLGIIETADANDDDASTKSMDDVPVPANTPVRDNLRSRGRTLRTILG
jgi:hypothetical protein